MMVMNEEPNELKEHTSERVCGGLCFSGGDTQNTRAHAFTLTAAAASHSKQPATASKSKQQLQSGLTAPPPLFVKNSLS